MGLFMFLAQNFVVLAEDFGEKLSGFPRDFKFFLTLNKWNEIIFRKRIGSSSVLGSSMEDIGWQGDGLAFTVAKGGQNDENK